MIEAEWLHKPVVLAVVKALGAENIRFVGGAVRDTLVGREVVDIDAATRYLPQETMRLLKESGIKVIPTGLQHGTVTAIVDDTSLEITTLRIDVETDGRHAQVAFTENWLEDAKRRDFTFNALYLEPDGTLYDPLGGAKDLQEGKVKFIGSVTDRIKEDALRILRLFRFHAHFGKHPIDQDALDAVRALAPMLKLLSVERIRTELSKLLRASDPLFALQTMLDVGLFTALDKNEVNLCQLKQLVENEKTLGLEIDPLIRLFTLFGNELGGDGLAKWLKLSNKNRDFLRLLEIGLASKCPADEKGLRCFIYNHGPEVSKAVAACKNIPQLLQYSEAWTAPKFPLQGRDLMAEGMLGGPTVGEALCLLENEWVESDFTLSKEELLARLGSV